MNMIEFDWRRIGFVYVFFLGTLSTAWAINFEQWVHKYKHLPIETSIQQFPVAQYLDSISLKDIQLLEGHRQYLNQHGMDGDDFMFAIFEKALETNPIRLQETQSVKKWLDLAEVHSYAGHFFPDSVFIYQVISDHLFASVADSLEQYVTKHPEQLKEFSTRYLIQRLLDKQYGIDVPINNWTKLKMYMKEGRWAYIWHKCTSTYRKEFLTAIVMGLLGLMTIGLGWRQWMKIRTINI